MGEDGARGLQASRQYPRFRMGSSCRVRESGPQEGKTGRGSGAGRPAPLPLPMLPPVRAHFGPRDSGGLESSEAGTASAGLVKIGNLLIILDGSPGRARRRTLGPVPQLQVAQDLFDDRAVADQADDFEWSGAAGTDQGIRFVHFLNQPGPRTPAVARELLAAVGIVLVPRLRVGRMSGCRSRSLCRNPARIGKSSVIADQLLSRIRDVGAQGGQEVERRKDAGRRGLGFAGGPGDRRQRSPRPGKPRIPDGPNSA